MSAVLSVLTVVSVCLAFAWGREVGRTREWMRLIEDPNTYEVERRLGDRSGKRT